MTQAERLTQELRQIQGFFALRREAQMVSRIYTLLCKTAGLPRLRSEMRG